MDLVEIIREHRRSRWLPWLCRDCRRRYPCSWLIHAIDQHQQHHTVSETSTGWATWQSLRKTSR